MTTETTIDDIRKLIAAGQAESAGTITDDVGEVYGVATRFDTQETIHVLLDGAGEVREWRDLD
jgi:hypothetical protein